MNNRSTIFKIWHFGGDGFAISISANFFAVAGLVAWCDLSKFGLLRAARPKLDQCGHYISKIVKTGYHCCIFHRQFFFAGLSKMYERSVFLRLRCEAWFPFSTTSEFLATQGQDAIGSASCAIRFIRCLAGGAIQSTGGPLSLLGKPLGSIKKTFFMVTRNFARNPDVRTS